VRGLGHGAPPSAAAAGPPLHRLDGPGDGATVDQQADNATVPANGSASPTAMPCQAPVNPLTRAAAISSQESTLAGAATLPRPSPRQHKGNAPRPALKGRVPGPRADRVEDPAAVEGHGQSELKRGGFMVDVLKTLDSDTWL